MRRVVCAKIKPGDIFNCWTVLGPAKDKKYCFLCRCVCGTEKEVGGYALVEGRSKSCGKCWRKQAGNPRETIVEPGTKFGSWTVLGPAKEPKKLSCRCECGTVKDVLKQSLLNGHSKSCGKKECRVVNVRHGPLKPIAPGTVFGEWTVLGPSKNEEKAKQGYFECQCSCGAVVDVYRSSLLRGISKSCQTCAGKRRQGQKNTSLSALNLKKAKDKYEGKEVNGFFIKKILDKTDKKNQFECIAVCPKCGNDCKTTLARIKSGITKCKFCNRDMGEKVHTVNEILKVDGTDLASLRARMSGTINKNSTTGANGVALTPKGRYRAYINFRRKQIGLGVYDDINDAIAARKEAEKLVYGKILEENEGWEQRLADAMAEYKKEKEKK